MNPLLFTLYLFGFMSHTYAQDDHEKQRLVAEIKKYDYVESWCLGFACNSYSELYKKAGSLFSISTIDNTLGYFNDTSYSLKYYSFLHILDHNDSLAFELLKRNISDDKKIDYQFADMSSNTKFIYLLVDEYRNFIKSKYLGGGRAVIRGHRQLDFPPGNKPVYRRKYKALNELLKSGNAGA